MKNSKSGVRAGEHVLNQMTLNTIISVSRAIFSISCHSNSSHRRDRVASLDEENAIIANVRIFQTYLGRGTTRAASKCAFMVMDGCRILHHFAVTV